MLSVVIVNENVANYCDQQEIGDVDMLRAVNIEIRLETSNIILLFK